MLSLTINLLTILIGNRDKPTSPIKILGTHSNKATIKQLAKYSKRRMTGRTVWIKLVKKVHNS
jgi:hypothetical protein